MTKPNPEPPGCPNCGSIDADIEALEIPVYESDADGYYAVGTESVWRCHDCGCVATEEEFRATEEAPPEEIVTDGD